MNNDMIIYDVILIVFPQCYLCLLPGSLLVNYLNIHGTAAAEDHMFNWSVAVIFLLWFCRRLSNVCQCYVHINWCLVRCNVRLYLCSI